MPYEPVDIERLEALFPATADEAFAAVRKRVLESGQSVLQLESGFIYEVFQNGERILIKKIEPPIKVVAGKKIYINRKMGD
jgi:hypothetical protein